MKARNLFFFKACPKCRGDMYLDEDVYGAFGKCLQCGRIYEARTSQPKVASTRTEKLAA